MAEAWHAFPSPGLIRQFDGSAFASQNCAAATWAMLGVQQQQGKRPAKGAPWYPTGASMRYESGDRSGGIMPSTLDIALNREYGIDLDVRIATVASVREALRDRRAVGALVRYKAISDAGHSGSPGFIGNHSVDLAGILEPPSGTERVLDLDPLYDGRRAGIPKGPQWIEGSTIWRAAGDLILDDSGVTVRQRYGSGRVYAVFTSTSYVPSKVVEDAPATAADKENQMIRGAWGVTSAKVQKLQPGQPLYVSPGGRRITRVSSTKPVFVSFMGKVGTSWGAVLVRTAAPYADGIGRPTIVYTPFAAGLVSNR